MNNNEIADSFSLLAKLMDIHGENSFKSKSYSSAAFAIDKLPIQLNQIPTEKISSFQGIGASSAGKIIELLNTGQLKVLDDLVLNTPPGVVEMLNIKGIGPKKINAVWKQMEVESIGELLYACKENRLKLFKGFGEKTQQNVADNIEFYLKSKGSFLYAQVDAIAPAIKLFLENIFVSNNIEFTGAYKRQLEIINELEFVIEEELPIIEDKISGVEGLDIISRETNHLIYNSSHGIKIKIYPATSETFIPELIRTSSSEEFNKAFELQFPTAYNNNKSKSEEAFFKSVGLTDIPSAIREDATVINMSKANDIPVLIQKEDIRGIIHCHSNWSDGSNTVEEMARAVTDRGMEYLVISDHSKSAFYANGLSAEKIKEQHKYIDELNEKLAPFKIFKSIESDILNDGSLDYPDAILASFDLVIASVHSNLKMQQEKAMMRLLKAIQNPYTTILGHMTGRLLLSRPGYPVDHAEIIKACAANNVAIELNAHPNRLDIDWRFIQEALKEKIMISIDPDSHFTNGLDDIKYGVLVAQKAMLTKESNLSSLSLPAFEAYLSNRVKKRHH